MARKTAVQLDREIDDYLRAAAPKSSRSSHSSGANPKEQLVSLLLQRTDEARQIARDLLLEHDVIRTGLVDAVHEVGNVGNGTIFQIGIKTATGSRLGENDPKRYWMTAGAVPAKGSSVDFIVTEGYPPTGKSAFAPKQQLHVVSILSGSLPESVIRRWIAKWWKP